MPNKTTRSAMLFEKFLRIVAGVDPYNPVFERVRYSPTPSSAELFDR